MQVRILDTTRRHDVQQFIRFPFQLYRGSAHWVPPLISEMELNLDHRRHPFYEHSTAAFFVAESGRETLGRIAVMHNRNHNAHRGAQVAFFGFLDVVPDMAVSDALFDAAFAWARKRGLEEIIGPRGLLGTDGGGVLVEGFEHRAALGIPYNAPYYDEFLQRAGFRKDTDHLSGYLRGDHQLPERFFALAERVKAHRGLTIKSFGSSEEMRAWVPRVAQAHKQAFAENHEYFPPTQAEMALIAENLIAVADPRLVKLVLQGEQVVGFVLAYHDISPALQRCRGRLWPLGWYYIMQERRRACWANVNGIGVLPSLQGLGASVLLYTELAKSLQLVGFRHAEVIQVNEANLKSKLDMETIGVRWYKRHRCYRRPL
ncbi:MAG: hypothetical protein ACUVX9_10410 [Anaerolineae bacterium]